MFAQITDPDKVVELYEAGLLWEKHAGYDTVPAFGWHPAALHMSGSGPSNFRFYVLLEE